MPLIPRYRYALGLAAILSGVSICHAQAKQDLCYDALTGKFYRMGANAALTPYHGRPHVSQDGSITWHVLNVNQYKVNVAITQPKQILLYRDQPPSFSISALVSAVIPPNVQQSVKSMGLSWKSTTPLDIQLQNLKSTVDDFNKRCSAFKELSILDASLKSIAAYGPDLKPIEGAKDPREPGRAATAQIKTKFQTYVASLFQSSDVPEVQEKGTQVQTGTPPHRMILKPSPPQTSQK